MLADADLEAAQESVGDAEEVAVAVEGEVVVGPAAVGVLRLGEGDRGLVGADVDPIEMVRVPLSRTP
ncbi:hypothetical protein [Phytomonospora endophytica]|uniref:Uncharacterized protein n=1 Tax=Phytomonospora endophytica TaxID=714109 RepID=A0A841FS15_9ACTN|nr:hypothetical protein [Phytomonospora endophytica]MBB6037603.1 hypothetical protein [Phytomonospora endophytica]